MTIRNNKALKIISIFLSVVLLVSSMPLMTLNVAAAETTYASTADKSTMDGWKNLFGKDSLSTEHAGSVWTDKSVFTDASAFGGTGITKDEKNSFLVALSTIGSSMSVTGMSSIPTDTILVLDVSGSMNSGSNDVAEELVESANASIEALLSSNPNNRVGVVLYSGPTTVNGAAGASDSVLMLPLDHYTTTNEVYLDYTQNSNEYISINSNVRTSSSARPRSVSKQVVGATYIQKGIILAMNQFTAASNTTTITDAAGVVVNRKPVVVLMSDGAPTVSSTNFTNPQDYNLGSGQSSSAAQGFVTQLSAAYAKNKIEAKYGTDCLFYTLGLGISNDSIATSVMNPLDEDANTGINEFWDEYLYETAVGRTVRVQGNIYNARHVTKISETLEQGYVDKYFEVDEDSNDLAQGLKDAFADIVGTIQLQSRYYPTLISESEDLSGYVSFVDRVGQYMEVTDVKGVLIHNTLFSGADMASNFVDGGGALGTKDEPTALGLEMVHAVQQRLGIDSIAEAEALIQAAYMNGQLSYISSTEFSNYIGWYANKDGEYLGFYHEGTTSLPEATGDAATDPVFVVKSYGYLGEVDEEHGVSKSDMMYATVQVRTNINTGEQIVTFAVPAALIPLVTYNVTLDEDGKLDALTVGGAEHPIRLVYEVALDDAINEYTVMELVDSAYLADEHNVGPNGEVYIYSNQWDHHNTTGYGMVNTYTYFNPSRQNDKYYYTEDTSVYADANGTLYTGTAQPSGVKYRAYTVYEKNGNTLTTKTMYRQMSAESVATALPNADGSGWHIPKGNIHVNLDGYTVYKGGNKQYVAAENATGTLHEAYLPFVDVSNHSVNDTGYNFYVGATLGNNGRLMIEPETGIKLTKTMTDGTNIPAEAFTFVLTNQTDAADNATYPAYYVKNDGTVDETVTVKFTNGTATVRLYAGEMLYIGGMTAGEQFRVVEQEVVDYVLTSVNGDSTLKAADLTVVANALANAHFVNGVRGKGTLTVAKEVTHDFGGTFVVPADKKFTITVTLSGIGTANATFAAAQTGSSITSVTTDANGSVTVTLGHEEQFEIFGLPEGTIATVVEATPGTGFVASYYEGATLGDGVVTIGNENITTVTILNDYHATSVDPVNIDVSGTKYFEYEDGSAVTNWNGAEFTVELHRNDADGTGWKTVDTAIVNQANPTFTFDLSGESFTKPGVYAYQVVEIIPATRLEGVLYDPTLHTFSVHVTDDDMDGKLEITRVHSEHADKDFTLSGGMWLVQPNFTNVQYTTAPAVTRIDVQKILVNESLSRAVSLAGFHFGLFTDAACTVPLTDAVAGIQKIDAPATDAMGESRVEVIFDEIGTYTFYLKETSSGNTYMDYSDKIVKVTVMVENGVGGRLVANTVYDTATNANGELEFTNTYDPADTALPIDFVNKVLNGRDMIAGEFVFELRAEDGTKLLTGTNAAAVAGAQAAIAFNDTLKFDKVGTYYYQIVEVGGDGEGVVTDKSVHWIAVTVADVNGQLTAHYVILSDVGEEIVFTNTYTAAEVPVIISGNKTLNGRPLINGEFTFVMTEVADADGTAKANAQTWSTTNRANGSFAFDEIYYTAAGTYYYEVSEKAGSTTLGVHYDTTKYIVTVKVIDNGVGELEIDSVTYKVKGGNAVNGITITNTYVPTPIKVPIRGTKTLEGKPLGANQYSFTLYASNASWTLGSAIETVKNAADGKFAFSAIEYTADGTYYYIVKEVGGGNTVDGITYDATEFRVRVTVTDDRAGRLTARTVVFDENNIPQAGVDFVNTYAITGSATATLEGNKTLDGRDLVDGAFTFELYETDESLVIGTTPAQTVTNANDKFTFDLTYAPEDAGKVFYYLIKEQIPANAVNNKLNGYTYDAAVYVATVTVSDDGDGTMSASAPIYYSVTNGALSVSPIAAITFRNKYEASADLPITLSGYKTQEGKDLSTEKFTFELYEGIKNADDTFKAGALLQTKQNNGMTVAFDKLSYTSVEAIGTHYYVIKEQIPAGAVNNKLNGYTYDTTTFVAVVTVTDNGNGTLAVNGPTYYALTADNKLGSSISSFLFTNSYAASADEGVIITANKTLNGKPLTEQFSFELYGATAETDGTITLGALLQTKQNVGAAITFDEIEYSSLASVGTHYYVVKEQIPAEAVDNVLGTITYDTAAYVVVVTVEDNGDGTLKVTAPTYYVLGEDNKPAAEAAAAINFVNTHTPTAITVDISGTKVLKKDGAEVELEDKEFVFNLYAVEGEEKELVATVKNAADGTFTFAGLTADKPGVLTYVITEGASPYDGINIDATEYTVVITVTDKEGVLVADTAITVDGKAVDELTFVNEYEPEPIPEPEPEPEPNEPTPPAEPEPDTGVNSNLSLLFVLMFVSGAALTATAIFGKKRRSAE